MKVSEYIAEALELIKAAEDVKGEYVLQIEANTASIVVIEEKLDTVEEGANNYVHPTNHAPSIIAQDSTNRFVTDTEKSTWNGKQAALVSGTNIKTINGTSLLGSGNISISGGSIYFDASNVPSVDGLSNMIGDNATDNTTKLQNLINYVESIGGGNIFIPKAENMYLIDGAVELKSNVFIYSNKAIFHFLHKTTTTDGFYNFDDSIDEIVIDGLVFYSTADYTIEGFEGALTSNRIGFHVTSASNIKVINCEFNGMWCGLKFDIDANIENLFVSNIKYSNMNFFIIINNTNKFYGEYISGSLLVTGGYAQHHHYYIGQNVVNMKLFNIYATGGLGWVFQFNSSGENTDVFISNVYAEDIARFLIAGSTLSTLTIKDVHIKNQSAIVSIVTVYDVVDYLFMDSFILESCPSLFISEYDGHVSTMEINNVTYLDAPKSYTVFDNIDKLYINNLKLNDANYIGGGSSTWAFSIDNTLVCKISNLYMHFTASTSNQDIIKVYDTNDLVIIDGVTITADIVGYGQTIWLTGYTNTRLFLSNFFVDTTDVFVYSGTPIAKVNCWLKGILE